MTLGTLEDVFSEDSRRKREEEFLRSEWFKTIEVLIQTLEVFLGSIASEEVTGKIPVETLKRFEEVFQKTYRALEMATYYIGLDLRRDSLSKHPLRVLWDRWETCKKLLNETITKFIVRQKLG